MANCRVEVGRWSETKWAFGCFRRADPPVWSTHPVEREEKKASDERLATRTSLEQLPVGDLKVKAGSRRGQGRCDVGRCERCLFRKGPGDSKLLNMVDPFKA